MGNNQERYIAGQTRYARNNPAGVKRSLYGVFRLFCNIIPAIRRFRHLLKLLSFQTSSLVEHLLSLSYRNFLNRICFILPKHAANIANILQCYALGMEIKQISRSFELSRNTVRRYVRLFQKCGIPIKELASMPSSRIQEMFSEGVSRSQIPSQRQLELEALPPEYLRPLPAIRHQMKEQRSATVMRNCYVTFKLHHYSMPKEYIGKRVEIVYDADTLKIYHGLRLVTTHQRDDTLYAYTTKAPTDCPDAMGAMKIK